MAETVAVSGFCRVCGVADDYLIGPRPGICTTCWCKAMDEADGVTYRYLVTVGTEREREVTKEQWVRLERIAGFNNTSGHPDEPGTGAFSTTAHGGIAGRIERLTTDEGNLMVEPTSAGERWMERVHCGEQLVVEQVVTTTYRVVCPVHGTYSEGLSLVEAHKHTRCVMPKRESGPGPGLGTPAPTADSTAPDPLAPDATGTATLARPSPLGPESAP